MKIGFRKDVFKPHVIKSIVVFLIFVFSWTNLGIYQVVYAATTTKEQKTAPSTSVISAQVRIQGEEKPQKQLQAVLKNIRNTIGKPSAVPVQTGIQFSPSVLTPQSEIIKDRVELDNTDTQIRNQFKQTEARIKNLPGIIKQRQKAFEKKYEGNLKRLKALLDSLGRAKTTQEYSLKAKQLKAFLDKVQSPERHIKLNPHKLPHRTRKSVWKSPRTNYRTSSLSPSPFGGENRRGKASPVQVASAGSLNGILSSAIIQHRPPPTAADLTSTIEVQFTPAILAKAQSLGYNATNIYNWVYDNIVYVPTYGSIQGADMCLQTMQCNDIDTASVLIALLRASNIPARYAYGTIQLPVNHIMNWVGGFTDPMSALELMAQGGVPITGEVAGGRIVAAKIEHVWVEAYVNYFPSRGARNGPGNEWIPLDGSYKQYTYTQGLNITQAVPFDTQSFINQITSTATINTQQGYVTNLNSQYISQTIQNYATQVANYIFQTNPNATVGDVIGKKQVIQQNFPYLPGTLQYQVLAKGMEYSALPNNLQYTISFQVTNSQTLQTDINYTVSLPAIAGKKVTLSYMPATSMDEAVIESYVPTGSSITISSLPTSLPAYLINMVPQLMVDGQVVATGSSIGLGGAETLTMTFTDANQYSDTATTNLTAGEYYGIGIDAGGISSQTVLNLQTQLSAVQSKLQAQDFTGMTKDDILGSLLYTTAVSYYAEYDMMDQTQAKVMGVVIARVPSEAIFSVSMNVSYMFGVATNVGAIGLKMDVQRNMELTQATDGNNNNAVQYMLASGQNSSVLESSVPEQLFSTPANPVQGISALKAIQIANDQGIPIYTVNQNNISTVLSQLQLPSDIISDIQNAVNAGEVVTVPQTQITYNSWIGVGYIIIDPTTGAGSYMISGGLGGAIIIMSVVMLSIIGIMCFAGAALLPLIFGLVLVTLMPLYYIFIRWLMISASKAQQVCTLTIIRVLAELALELNIGFYWHIPFLIEHLITVFDAILSGVDLEKECS